MHKKHILFTMAAVTSLVSLDTTIVGVALPSIARSLHATFADVQWVIGGYVLCSVSLLIPFGVLGDHRGRRTALLAGVSIFALASLLSGLAQSASTLVAARVLQGVGAAFLPSAALGVLSHTFRGPERARAFGVWGAAMGFALIAGPIVGGIITSLWGWRWTFLINIPLGAALLAAVWRLAPDAHDPDPKRYDVLGSLTLCGTLFLLTWALINPHEIAMRLGGSALCLLAFIAVERRHSNPMLDLAMFSRPAFLGAVVAMIGYSAAAQVLMFFLPLYLQNAFGYSPLWTGAAMLPFAVPLFVVPRMAARASVRYGNRSVLFGGLLVVAAGDFLLALTAPQLRYALFAVAMTITGIGAGALNGQTAQAVMSTIPPERGSMAGGLGATVRWTAVLLAVALLGGVLTYSATGDFSRRAEQAALSVNAAPLMRRVIAGDESAALQTFSASARENIAQMAHQSVAFGVAWLMAAAALVALVSGVLTWRLLPSPTTVRRAVLEPIVAGD